MNPRKKKFVNTSRYNLPFNIQINVISDTSARLGLVYRKFPVWIPTGMPVELCLPQGFSEIQEKYCR